MKYKHFGGGMLVSAQLSQCWNQGCEDKILWLGSAGLIFLLLEASLIDLLPNKMLSIIKIFFLVLTLHWFPRI